MEPCSCSSVSAIAGIWRAPDITQIMRGSWFRIAHNVHYVKDGVHVVPTRP